MPKQVITIDDISAENAPVIYVAGGLNQFYEAVKAEVTGEVPDLSTAKGRARIASLAAKVSSSKSAVEKPGRDYLKRIKELPKVVEGELKIFVDAMNALRDETRKPLTDWETAEVARRDSHKDAIQQIEDLALFEETPTAASVTRVIENLELVVIDESWEEFLAEAAQAKDKSLAKLRTLLADRTKHEAELAAIAKFNAEKAVREQQERDAAIARDAAEKATQEAEQKAKDEREASARREQELKDQAEQQERKLRDTEAEAERQKKQADQERIDSQKRQAEAVEKARLDEIARQEEEAAETARQQRAREADQAHKIKIMGEAKAAFIGMNISEELAKAIVLKIARGEVPNVKINF